MIVIAADSNELKPVIDAQRLFDRTVNLLNQIVQVAIGANLHEMPASSLATQKAQRTVARTVAIKCDLARQAIGVGRQRFTKECFGRFNAAIRTQQEVHGAPR